MNFRTVFSIFLFAVAVLFSPVFFTGCDGKPNEATELETTKIADTYFGSSFAPQTLVDTASYTFLISRETWGADSITWQVVADTVSGTANIDLFYEGSNIRNPTADDWFQISTATITITTVPDTTFKFSTPADFWQNRLRIVQDNGVQSNLYRVGFNVK